MNIVKVSNELRGNLNDATLKRGQDGGIIFTHIRSSWFSGDMIESLLISREKKICEAQLSNFCSFSSDFGFSWSSEVTTRHGTSQNACLWISSCLRRVAEARRPGTGGGGRSGLLDLRVAVVPEDAVRQKKLLRPVSAKKWQVKSHLNGEGGGWHGMAWHGTEVTFALLTHTELGSNPGSADIFLSHYWLVHG